MIKLVRGGEDDMVQVGKISGAALDEDQTATTGKGDVVEPGHGESDGEDDELELEVADDIVALYHPVDLDEQRRAWVIQTLGCDWPLEDLVKAADWLKTGTPPAKPPVLKSVLRNG